MSSQITQWGASQWVGMAFGLVDVPAHYWFALCNGEPGTGVDGTMLAQLEPPVVSGSTTYARASVANDDDHFALSDSGYVANLLTIGFGEPDLSWGYIPYYAICDALTDGHVYAYGQFTNPAQMAPGFEVKIPIGAFVLQGFSAVASIVT